MSHHVGQAVCYWVSPLSGVIIVRSTLKPAFSSDELTIEDFTAQLERYDQTIAEKFAYESIGMEPPLTLFDLDDYEQQERLEPLNLQVVCLKLVTMMPRLISITFLHMCYCPNVDSCE